MEQSSTNQAIWHHIDSIAEHLATNISETTNVGLLGGDTGRALALLYYDRYRAETDKFGDLGSQLLVQVIEKLQSGVNSMTFATGLSGIAWTIQHLQKREFTDLGDSNLLEQLDEILLNHVKSMLDLDTPIDLDYLHGAQGPLLYLIDRGIEYSIIPDYLLALETLAVEDRLSGGWKWPFRTGVNKDNKTYNLSVSHGIGSIISILGSMYLQNANQPKIPFIIDKALLFLRSTELDPEKYYCTYPSTIPIAEDEPSGLLHSRLAWCYGDLGLALVLLKVGKLMNKKELITSAVATLKKAAIRRSEFNTSVKDAGLCHGAAGNALLFHQAYISTKLDVFEDAKFFWLSRISNYATFKDTKTGFKKHTPEGFIDDSSLLEGTAGIMLSALTSLVDMRQKDDWYGCLLV